MNWTYFYSFSTCFFFFLPCVDLVVFPPSVPFVKHYGKCFYAIYCVFDRTIRCESAHAELEDKITSKIKRIRERDRKREYGDVESQ